MAIAGAIAMPEEDGLISRLSWKRTKKRAVRTISMRQIFRSTDQTSRSTDQ
jgi:hypothetical protein